MRMIRLTNESDTATIVRFECNSKGERKFFLNTTHETYLQE